MLLWAVIFLGAALVTVSVIFLIVGDMINQLEQIPAAERRIPWIFSGLHRIIREHNRLFPQSGLMLAFWLSIVYLVIWLSAMGLSLVMDLGDL